jgi:hypothetical protein
MPHLLPRRELSNRRIIVANKTLKEDLVYSGSMKKRSMKKAKKQEVGNRLADLQLHYQLQGSI